VLADRILNRPNFSFTAAFACSAASGRWCGEASAGTLVAASHQRDVPMNVIRLALTPTVSRPPDAGVAIWVDGESVIDHVRRLEAPWWAAIDCPQPDTQYVWVPARTALLSGRHLLGEPAVPWCGGFSAVVLCECGEYLCRAYAVKVQATPGRVVWSAWAEMPEAGARLCGLLRPFEFDRRQYEEELAHVSAEYRAVATLT
jgi:hypothetical protein